MRRSALALVAANLVPLYGVLALGWTVGPILLFYWSENLVVGFFNVLKMARAQGSVANSRTTLNGRPVTMDSRGCLIFFFIVHYGIFTLAHGVFVIALFQPRGENLLWEIIPALLFLFASHGYSFFRHFIHGGEYRTVPFTRLFWQPYRRVIIMHLTIILGGFLVQALDSPLGVLLVLVALKILIDLMAHGWEHRGDARKSAPGEAAAGGRP
ncbi:MAG: hypothetical protein JXO51_08680 [Candidatus Aminicenantes bacterium]|nr:hypothetical protein [Candidatus Aminicenantes bacterium]